MKRRSLFVAVAICISFLRVTVSNAQPSATNGLGLSLQAIDPVIKAGSSPRFSLTVTNVSDHVCRVLDFERRADLRDTYCNLAVLRDGKPVDVLRAISDPGPFSDSDYLLILPGHAKTFMLARFPDQFEALSPGVYEAYVDFWHYPYESHSSAYKLPRARFTVKK